MSSKKGHTEPFVRCYEVGSPTLHPDGYTIYKVTQQVATPIFSISVLIFISQSCLVLIIGKPLDGLSCGAQLCCTLWQTVVWLMHYFSSFWVICQKRVSKLWNWSHIFSSYRQYSICRIPNMDSGLILWNRPFSARSRIRICKSSESGFDADSLAKPEVNDLTPASPTWTNNNDVTMEHALESRPSIC